MLPVVCNLKQNIYLLNYHPQYTIFIIALVGLRDKKLFDLHEQ